MTLQQIHYALVTAETGTINKASEKLFITQPTLTSAIKELESDVGITIFNRTNHGVTVTREGQDFLMYARQVYRQYETLLERYSGSRQAAKKKFRVSCQHYSFVVKAFAETVNTYGTLNYEFAIKETQTLKVIEDVGNSYSDVGVLYMSSYNRKYLSKLLDQYDLVFRPLVSCAAYVYLWKDHPLGKETSIRFDQLRDYPYLSFDQGENAAFYLAEEILSENEYPRTVKVSDRATALNLMKTIGGYMLCSGIINQELNGSDYIVIPYESDAENPNSVMEIGYITKKQSMLSTVCETFLAKMKAYFA